MHPINREDEIRVSTVEMHLTNAYRKLDISSGDQLPAALRAT